MNGFPFARPYSYHPLPPELTFILFILKAPVRSRKRPDGHDSKEKNQNKLYVSWGYAGLSEEGNNSNKETK